MSKINVSERDKYICYCERVTYESFLQAINNNAGNFNSICNNLKVAQKCVACLPNIEDFMISNKGAINTNFNVLSKNKDIPLYKKILNFIDYLSGNMIPSLRGTLPAVVSKEIETWLVISNTSPKILNHKKNKFKLECKIYDENGIVVKRVSNIINSDETFKLCINNYVDIKYNSFNIYTIDVIRNFQFDGYRGSTRPHFFYKTKSSMAALHTQDGGSKNLSFDMIFGNQKEKRWLFISNLENRDSKINFYFYYIEGGNKILFKEDFFIMKSRGSKLLEVPTYKNKLNYKKISIFFKSLTLVKTNLVISDEKFKYVSVDHL